VLGRDRVSPEDNFFELGGHSLLAVSLAERLRQRGIPVPVWALFESPTPAGLAAASGPDETEIPPNLIPPGAAEITPDMVPLAGLTAAEIDRVTALVDGGAPNVADVYPLAPLQEGILFHHLMTSADGTDVYLTPMVLRFDSRTRLDEFLGALRQVIARHDIYRTSLAWEGLRQPAQVVWRDVRLPVTEITLEGGPGAGAVTALLAAGGARMDLRRAPLLALVVAAEPGSGRWLAMVQIHHLLMDHTSMEVLISELHALMSGREDRLAPPLPFRAFVAQASLGMAREEHERFFAALLADVTEPTAPFGLLDTRVDGTATRLARLAVEEPLGRRVRERARELGVSPATLFHLVWARVLAAVSGQDDVVFGTVVFGRMNAGPGADRIPGPFINTLPVRVDTARDNIASAVAAMREQLAGLMVHEHAPLTVAQQASGIAPGVPLFTSIFNFRHSAVPVSGDAGLATTDGIEMLHLLDLSNYPLDVAVDDTGNGFIFTVKAVPPADPELVCGLLHTATEGLVEALEEL
jgi:hypothetical protein